jgi:hypothetical protein
MRFERAYQEMKTSLTRFGGGGKWIEERRNCAHRMASGGV